MNVEDFDRRYRFRMVAAYPVISGVPDVYAADREQIDEGFRYLLESRNLRRTHELYLARPTLAARRGTAETGDDDE